MQTSSPSLSYLPLKRFVRPNTQYRDRTWVVVVAFKLSPTIIDGYRRIRFFFLFSLRL